jgi:hypothetical protein
MSQWIRIKLRNPDPVPERKPEEFLKTLKKLGLLQELRSFMEG